MSSNLASSKRANVYGKARHIFARKCLSYLFRPGFHYAGLAFAIQALEYRSAIRQNSRECQMSGSQLFFGDGERPPVDQLGTAIVALRPSRLGQCVQKACHLWCFGSQNGLGECDGAPMERFRGRGGFLVVINEAEQVKWHG